MTGPLDQFEREQVQPKPGMTLIVGSKLYRDREDRRKRYPEAIGVDMLPGDGVDLVLDLEDSHSLLSLPPIAHIECLSVLEHTPRPWLMAQTLSDLLLPGGTIFVDAPFCWPYHGYPKDYWRFTQDGLMSLFPAIDWKSWATVRDRLYYSNKIDRMKCGGHPYFPRTTVCAFGVKA